MSLKTRQNHHEKVKEIFSAVIELPSDKQSEFLKNACKDDEDLYNEVKSLLNARNEAGEFLEDVSAVSVIHDSISKNDKLIGQKIDKYRIVSELGRGGMGVVFLAEREDFHQQTALKIIKRGMDSDAILERFTREREILAALNHPFIARLLDGGTTEDNLPFFVMEYVEGVSVDEYCRKNGLSNRQKLELFRKICEAVTFAHQKLVVHRDLKPSNILVISDGTPKLLDFGIAKLLNSNNINETETNQRILTPAYASPEQIRGEPIDTTSDVYSLGKILSEVLPLEGKETNNQRSKTENQKTDTDLQAILETSLREESTRRYISVEKFSDDIRRYLIGLPISAQKDTFSYRARKFVQRNHISVTVAALFILTLLTGLTAVIWEDRKVQREHAKAEQRFNDVRKLANSFMFEFNDAIENLPGSTPARKLVVDRALEYLNKLSEESGEDASLQRELATAYERIGRIQGNSYFSNLGDTKGAMQSYQHSLAIRQKLSVSDSQNIELQDELANSFEGVGDMFYTMDDLKSGLSSYQNALAIREKLVQTNPNNLDYQNTLADIYGKVGDISGFDGYPNLGDTESSLENYEKAVAIDEKLFQTQPDSLKFQESYAQKLTNLGMLERTVGKTRDAISSCEKAAELLKSVLSNDPNNTEYKYNALTNNTALRYALTDEGRVDEAIELSRQTIKMLEEMQTADPQNALIKRSREVAYNMLSRTLLQKNGFSEAVRNSGKALTIIEDLSQSDPDSIENKADLAHTLQFLGEAQFAAHDYNSALSNLNRALSINEKNLEGDTSNARTRDDVSICLADIGNVLAGEKKLNEALKDFQKSIPLAKEDSKQSPASAVLHSRLALRYFEMGKIYEELTKTDVTGREESKKEAENSYQKSFDIWNEMQSKEILNKMDAKNLQSVLVSLNNLKN